MYKAFVDNYKVALETAEKCSQSNNQFQKISEVGSSLHSHPYNSGLWGLLRAFQPLGLSSPACQLGKQFF